MSLLFLRSFFYERNCTTSKPRSRDAAPKNLFPKPTRLAAPSGCAFCIYIHHHPSCAGCLGRFCAFFCVVCEDERTSQRRIEGGRQVGDAKWKAKQREKNYIPGVCAILFCPALSRPACPLSSSSCIRSFPVWHKGAWCFGDLYTSECSFLSLFFCCLPACLLVFLACFEARVCLEVTEPAKLRYGLRF